MNNTIPLIESEDNSSLLFQASNLIPNLKKVDRREVANKSAILAEQFIGRNQQTFKLFDIHPRILFNGFTVNIQFTSGIKVGAFPLISPTTGKPDYGFIVKPRFGWNGLGPMLGVMGWKIIPKPIVSLPILPKSDRKIPPWVLSSIILFRIKDLLDNIVRKFEDISDEFQFPKGRVNWTKYATQKVSRADLLSIPCTYSDLNSDSDLKSAIHFVLRRHLRSLESQRTSGLMVIRLIDLCQNLLLDVIDYSPILPTSKMFDKWKRNPMQTDFLYKGIEAMQWSIEEKGFAGFSDLQGLPWILSMEDFFEAWVETVSTELAYKIGGMVSTGRERQTVTPILWKPAYSGSQKYLLPDIVLEKENEVVIIDAKYKKHWEELSFNRWSNIDEQIRKHHREDLLQALAYSTLFDQEKITACLAYPCHYSSWCDLKERGRVYHKADLSRGNKKIQLVIIALPMEENLNQLTDIFKDAVSF